MQISSDYYEKTTVHIFLSVSACTRYKSTRYPNLGGLPQNRYRKQFVLAKQTEGNTKREIRHLIEPDHTYDTSKIEAFLVPAGTGIEVYATTLHYAPCHVNEGGFQCVVVLPKGTNTELTFPTEKTGEDSLMTAKNKWLIAHEDAKIEGAFNGLKGENITID